MLFIRCCLIVGLLPCSVLADPTLYICHTPQGSVLLTNVPDKQCLDPVEYQYPSYKKDEHNSDQRKSSERKSPEYGPEGYPTRVTPSFNPPPQTAFYEDPSACAYYKWVFNDAASIVDVKKQQDLEIPPIQNAILNTQMNYAKEQMQIACPHGFRQPSDPRR